MRTGRPYPDGMITPGIDIQLIRQDFLRRDFFLIDCVNHMLDDGTVRGFGACK